MKWYQEITVLNKEIDGSMFHCFDEENYKKISDEREEQLREIERLQGNIEILADDLGNIGYMLGLEEGSCYEDVLEEIRKLQEEIERLHSIIKEVREYIEEHIEWEVDGEEGIDYTAWINFKGTSYEYFVKELLEILDKENI